MTVIRLQGTPEEIKEAIEAIDYALTISPPSRLFRITASREVLRDGEWFCCFKIMDIPKVSFLIARIEKLYYENQELISQLQEAHQTIAQLDEELGKLPKPEPHAAVLGSPHKKVEQQTTSNS